LELKVHSLNSEEEKKKDKKTINLIEK